MNIQHTLSIIIQFVEHNGWYCVGLGIFIYMIKDSIIENWKKTNKNSNRVSTLDAQRRKARELQQLKAEQESLERRKLLGQENDVKVRRKDVSKTSDVVPSSTKVDQVDRDNRDMKLKKAREVQQLKAEQEATLRRTNVKQEKDDLLEKKKRIDSSTTRIPTQQTTIKENETQQRKPVKEEKSEAEVSVVEKEEAVVVVEKEEKTQKHIETKLQKEEEEEGILEYLRIFIKTKSDEKFTLNVVSSDTILEIKNRIQNEVRASTNSMRLIFSGQMLHDDRTLGGYKVKDGNTLLLVVNPTSNTH